MSKSPPGPLLIKNENVSNYLILGFIGKGSTSLVYKAENPSEDYNSPLRCVAFKRLPADCNEIGTQESVILSAFKGSKYIVEHYGTFSMNGQLVLTFELLDWKRNFSISNFDPRSPYSSLRGACSRQVALAKIALQLLLAVQEMNTKGYVHGDIKPSNIMFQRGHRNKIKLIDLGNAVPIMHLSKYHDDFDIQPMGYRAPEVVMGDYHFNEKIDIWSIGVVLLELYVNSLFTSQEGTWVLIQQNSRAHYASKVTEYVGPLDIYAGKGKLWSSEYSSAKPGSGPKKQVIKAIMQKHDPEDTTLLENFILVLLNVDHNARPSVSQALCHRFLVDHLIGDWAPCWLARE